MSAYSVAHSTGSCTSLICHSTSPSLHFPSISQETVVLDDYSHCSDLNTVKMSSIGVSLAGSMSHLCGSEKSDITPISAMKVCPIMCPCGNRQTCPLSERKVACLLEDSRVSRGFTLLSAIFRGRLTRQLLATHKVCDLIRTVKDTAKLALSLHLERQSSIQGIVSGPQALSSDEPVELSDQELILESRLLAQIQGTLNQIHEIFFTWPVSEKLSLLSASRSVSKKFKRPISGAENMETSNFSISSHSFTNNSTSKSSSQVSPSTSRVLRQLQPHQVNSPYKASQINKDGEKKRDVCIIRIESTDAQYKPNILPCRTNNQIPKSRKQQIQNENKPCTENNLRIGKSTVIQGNCRYNECKNNSKAYSQVSGAFTQSNVIDSQFRLEKKNKTSFHSFRSFRKLSGQSDHLSDSPVSQARTLSLRAVSVTCASKMSGSYKPANIGINASSLVRGGLKQGINKHSSKKTPEYELKPRIDNSPTPSRNEPSDKNSQSNMFTSERETNLKESKNVATSQINDFNTFSSSGTSNSNNFNNYLETSGKEKLSISFKQQANGPTCSTLSQCNAFSKKKALQSPLTDNDSPKKVYYPVKRRIISRQPRSESKTIVIQQPTDQDALTVETNHNCSNFQWFFLGEQQYSKDIYQNNKYNEISSSDQLFVQQNQPINDESTLRSTTRSTNTDNSLGNIGITNYCENSNASNHISKLRTTWTLDNPLLPSPTSEC
ncbi:unnamed protein product [Heterobilharzia americana]|nr:unnamed protein product [Heterobilharzia americana]